MWSASLPACTKSSSAMTRVGRMRLGRSGPTSFCNSIINRPIGRLDHADRQVPGFRIETTLRTARRTASVCSLEVRGRRRDAQAGAATMSRLAPRSRSSSKRVTKCRGFRGGRPNRWMTTRSTRLYRTTAARIWRYLGYPVKGEDARVAPTLTAGEEKLVWTEEWLLR